MQEIDCATFMAKRLDIQRRYDDVRFTDLAVEEIIYDDHIFASP
jgi:hypothetical protein